MNKTQRLSDIEPGERATVLSVGEPGSIRRRLMDIGFLRDATVECVGRSPLGDPAAYRICGAIIAIRNRDARHIIVKKGRCGKWA